MSDKFGVFCKSCGSYNVEIFISPKDIFISSEKEIMMECFECSEQELVKADTP